MVNQGKNIVIGLFVLAALAILIFILLYLHPSVGDNAQTFYVRFNNIDKISIGTRVSLGGRPIGEVVDIQEVPDARQELKGFPGPTFIYLLTLKIDSHIKLYKSDIFSIRTSGLLGEKSVEITPMPPPEGQPFQPLTSKDVVFSEPSYAVEEALKQFDVLGKKIGKALDYINDDLSEFKEKKIMENVAKTVEHLNELTAAIDQPKDLKEIIQNIHTLSENIKNAWPKIDEAIGHFHSAAGDIAGVTGKVGRGEGSIGKLLNNEEIYLQVSSVLSKASTLMDDINHYGLLFQNDKRWQRVRGRRVNLMSQLKTPQEFRNFFDDEIDQISTSLARVSMVLDSAKSADIPDEILGCKDFARVYAELLRRVKVLQDNLLLYDQQVWDVCDRIAADRCPLPVFEARKVCEPKLEYFDENSVIQVPECVIEVKVPECAPAECVREECVTEECVLMN